MKVLLVNKFHYRKGGAETYYFTLAEALRAGGHEVIFFSMKDSQRNLPCEQEKYFVSNAAVKGPLKSRMNLAVHIAYSKEAYGNMRRLLRDERPDLVILNNIHRQITLSVIDAVKDFDSRLPVFWTMHDLAAVCPAYTMLDGSGNICEQCLDGDVSHCIKNRCMKGSRLMGVLAKHEADSIRKKGLYDKVDLYICPSEFLMEMLHRAGFTRGKLVLMRNPLPISAQYEWRHEPEEYILYFGRLSKEKGIRTLIDAQRKIGCRLEIVGTGPDEKELKDYVKLAKAEKIVFRGFQTGQELENSIKKSRCVIVPSICYENGPYNVMEAMAWGKPLIVSGCGGLPELVGDGKNGYVYDGASANSSEALAECIRKMLALTDQEYWEMAQCSREKARELFDAEQYVCRLEKYYGAWEHSGEQKKAKRYGYRNIPM